MKKKFIKITSLILAINFLTTTLAPTLIYALTSGPTAPEYSTFEPVDTTEMVDLSTGDLTYNIALLEVPGPEGGYPMALSYHAGISPDEESSWVGLGWNINAGAINRNISGYPDDFNNISSSVYDYWSGGSTENFRVGLGFNAGVVGVNYAITYSSDTYKGTGLGYEFTYKFMAGSRTIGKDPYGNVIDRTSVGISPTIFKFINVNANVTNDNITGDITKSAGVGIGMPNQSLKESQLASSLGLGSNSVGASISTNGGGVSASVFGASGYSNKTSGIVNTISKGVNLGSFLSYNYQRYWTSEQTNVSKFGSLYYPESPSPENQTFDSFTIPYIVSPNDWNGEVDKQLGGSLPAYDNYTVLGQGVGGAIQPYILDNVSLFRQNRKKVIEENLLGPDLSYTVLSPSTKKVNFRFKNDFSNSYTRNVSTYSDPTNIGEINAITNEIDNVVSVNPEGFNSDDNHLAGSKHIEWFTINQINNPDFDKQGFIHEALLPEIVNGYSVSSQIGGFMITNESGVTYHYGLPVYAFNEFSLNKNNNHGDSYRRETNPHPYAYTWLLTAITGPDYVDRGTMGAADESDWGYWVKFNYGKWTDQYKWRNPTQGFHKQLDQNTLFYSRGQKELYYLDAVITRSHTALFEKEIRNDAKGYVDNDAEMHDFSPSAGNSLLESDQTFHSGIETEFNFPVSTLALSNIYLFENKRLNSFLLSKGVNSILDLKNKGNRLKNVVYNISYCAGRGEPTSNCTNPQSVQKTRGLPFNIQNVIDTDDFSSLLSDIKTETLKTIAFNYSYDLCKNTVNSFSNTNALYGNANNEITEIFNKQLDGKLTLKSFQVLGKEGAVVIPSTTFQYTSGVKNPDYDQNKRDVWGMYKSDYEDQGDENLDRFTSNESAKYVDAWSLTSIKSALGADINITYESDEYNEVALERIYGLKVSNFSFVITTVNGVNMRYLKLEFNPDVNLSEISNLNVNSVFSFKGIARYHSDEIVNMPVNSPPLCKCENDNLLSVYYWRYFRSELKVAEVGTNYALFTDFTNSNIDHRVDIYNLFFSNLGSKYYSCDKYTVVEDDDPGSKKVYDFTLPEFVGGELLVSSKGITQKGGGLRVKSIATSLDDNKTIYKVDYSYVNGVTSYEPTSYNKTKFSLLPYNDVVKCMKNIGETNAIQDYRNSFNNVMANVLAYAPIVQGPGVIYKNVTIRNSSVINNQTSSSPEYQTFVFSTPAYGMGSKLSLAERTDERTDGMLNLVPGSLNKVTIRDYSQRVGNLESVTTYDKDGNPLYEVMNTYMNDEPSDNVEFISDLASKYSNQGRIDQVFHEARTFGDGGLQRVITRKEEYPNILIKTRARNYKTNLIEESYTNSFDYYTGAPLEVINTDSYGNVYKKVFKPAYDQYNAMGLKVNNSSNRHMLSQNASTTIYKVVSLTDLTPKGLVSAHIQTWSNEVPVLGVGIQSNVWRKHANYSWIGSDMLLADGTNDPATFNTDPFTYWIGSDPGTSSLWQKDGEITLYNPFSLAIESRSINSNYASLKTDPANKNVTFSASHGSYSETAFSGAEYYNTTVVEDGGVNKEDGIPNTLHAHTGGSSLEVGENKEGFSFTLDGVKLDPSRRYKASVWVYFSGSSQGNLNDAKLYYTVGGIEVTASPVESKKSKNWYLINLDIVPNGNNNIRIGCKNISNTGRSIYFDDFRVHPLDCSVTSYVYDQKTNELIYILDNDNCYTKYDYDTGGRLKRIYKEFFHFIDKKVSDQYYNYGRIYR